MGERVLLTAVLAVLVAMSPAAAFERAGDRKILVWAGRQEVPTIDPSVKYDWSIRMAQQSLYDALVKYVGNPPEIVPWLVTFRILPGAPLDRASLIGRLREAGIDARPLWHPLVDLPPYSAEARRRGTLTPRSRAILERAFWLPTSSRMTFEQVDFVADEVRKALSA